MRSIIRKLAYNTAAIWLLSTLVPSISYGDTLYQLLLTASVLTVLELIIQPIISLLLLPLNLLLLGLLSWLPYAISLYLVTLTLDNFYINPLTISQTTLLNIAIPNIHLGKFSTIIVSSFLIKLLRKLLRWLLK